MPLVDGGANSRGVPNGGLSAGEWAAVLIGVAAATLPSVMPALVGAMADQPGIGTDGAGYIVSTNMAGIFVGSLLAAALLRHVPPRRLLTSGLVLMLAGNLVTMLVTALGAQLAARGGSGIGEGIAAAVCYALMGKARRPGLALSAYLAGQSILGMAGMAVLPWVIARSDWRSFYLGVSAIGLLALPLVRRAAGSAEISVAAGGPAQGSADALRAWVMLATIFLFFSAMALIWAFLEQIGRSQGLSLTVVSGALSMSAGLGLVGSLAAGPLSTRLSPRLAALVGMALVTTIAALLSAPGAAAFFAAAGLLSFVWTFQYPFFFRQLAMLDPGRATAVTPSATGIALAVGPALGGMLIAHAGLGTAIVAFFLLAISALLLGLVFQARGNGALNQDLP